MRALAARDHFGPDGRWVRVGRSTLDRWVRILRAGGFEALVPVPRRGVPTTPVEVLALAETFKRDVPERTAAQVRRVMLEAAGEEAMAVPSVRTLQRHFARVGLNMRPDGGPPRAFGRFQADRPNERWMGDALHGPMVGGRKAYLLAFLDDYSRLTGYRWTYSEDTVRLEAALRQGLACRGVPKAILVDRGSAYVGPELARSCAVLGIRLVHARPALPDHEGENREVFRTMRAGFWSRSTARRRGGSRRAEPALRAPGSRSSTTTVSTPRPRRPRSSVSWKWPSGSSHARLTARGVLVVERSGW